MLNKSRIACIVLLLISMTSVLATFIAPMIPFYDLSTGKALINMYVRCFCAAVSGLFVLSSAIAYIISYRIKNKSLQIIIAVAAYINNVFFAGFCTLVYIFFRQVLDNKTITQLVITAIYLLTTALITTVYIILSTKRSDITTEH